jgi:hypothetical protein
MRLGAGPPTVVDGQVLRLPELQEFERGRCSIRAYTGESLG